TPPHTLSLHDALPISAIPDIESIRPTPVAGRPQESHLRRLNPGAGHPEIPIRTIGPESRGPDVAGRRDRRLLINGQRRRRNVDRSEEHTSELQSPYDL